MLVSAIALTLICVASFAVIPSLWWTPRSARKDATSGLVGTSDRQNVTVTFKPQSGRSFNKAA
jgi:hypothetical protein